MFKTNKKHLQTELFGTTVLNLPQKIQKRLKNSWAESFYTELFCKINEQIFRSLYSDKKSRPNVPINILVGLEILKSGYGWSDEEMYDAYLFNLQVRYALGIRDMDEFVFELRTVYNFRRRVSNYIQDTGKNPLDDLFSQITDEQIKKYGIKTDMQRMDSTLIASNIRNMSRIQLLVEILQRVWRELKEEEKEKYKKDFELFIKGTAIQYCYKIKTVETNSRLEIIGKLMNKLLTELNEAYKNEPAYKILKQVFKEHFKIKNQGAGKEKIIVRDNKELKASNIQSPDDLEATYRKKGKESSKGYVGNITETCNKENKFQLITKAQVAPNITDDETLLVEATKELKERTEIKEIYTDGGYTGEAADKITEENNIEHKVTAVRGGKNRKEEMDLNDFKIEEGEDDEPQTIKCVGEQRVEVNKGKKEGRYVAKFDGEKCQECPYVDKCPVVQLKKQSMMVLRFSEKDIKIGKRKQKYENNHVGVNIRAAVESTIRSLIHPFGGHLCKLPVRGRKRVTQMVIYGALMVNIKRIARYKKQIEDNVRQLSKKVLLIYNYFNKFLNFICPNFIFSVG